jgi:glycosyltransferase involved in cell wall biosynthesis
MKIVLLASDEATAPLYRIRLLARVLSRQHEVEVLGFQFDQRLDPVSPRDFPYRAFAARPWPRFLTDARAMIDRVRADVVYAMKPRPSSYGVALALRARRGVPVVVDVDDWEPFMVAPYSRWAIKNAWWALPRWGEPNNYLATRLCDSLVGLADGVTTVSRFLQTRYGGVLVPQVVDTEHYDPERFDRAALRQAHGLAPYQVCVFAGIAQPNKGVGEILEAFRLLGDRQDWRLVIVGPKTPYALSLAREDARVILLGTQPPERTPEFLAMADLVVLPQRDEPASQGQMPMKLYEAMAMACPVISTAVSDIPELLENRGLVVPPGQPRHLASAIRLLLDDPALARGLGLRARELILERYRYEHGAETLGALFERVRARGARLIQRGQPC